MTLSSPNSLPSPRHGGFLKLREEWLKVETIDRGDGAWDVALIIDGTYFGEGIASKAALVDYFTQWIAEELGGDDQVEVW